MTQKINKFIDTRTKIKKISDRISKLAEPLDAGVFMHQYRDRTQDGLYSYKFELGSYEKKWADKLLELLLPLYSEFSQVRKIRITISQPYGWHRKMMSLRVWVDASDKAHTPVKVPTQPEVTGIATPIAVRFFMGSVMLKNENISTKIITDAKTFGGAVGKLYNHCDNIFWLKEIEHAEYSKLERGKFHTI